MFSIFSRFHGTFQAFLLEMKRVVLVRIVSTMRRLLARIDDPVSVRSTPWQRQPARDLGARTLDVPAMYNRDRFRPRYEAKLGSPLLLGPAVIG